MLIKRCLHILLQDLDWLEYYDWCKDIWPRVFTHAQFSTAGEINHSIQYNWVHQSLSCHPHEALPYLKTLSLFHYFIFLDNFHLEVAFKIIRGNYKVNKLICESVHLKQAEMCQKLVNKLVVVVLLSWSWTTLWVGTAEYLEDELIAVLLHAMGKLPIGNSNINMGLSQ